MPSSKAVKQPEAYVFPPLTSASLFPCVRTKSAQDIGWICQHDPSDDAPPPTASSPEESTLAAPSSDPWSTDASSSDPWSTDVSSLTPTPPMPLLPKSPLSKCRLLSTAPCPMTIPPSTLNPHHHTTTKAPSTKVLAVSPDARTSISSAMGPHIRSIASGCWFWREKPRPMGGCAGNVRDTIMG
jgi:hypothetical protein